MNPLSLEQTWCNWSCRMTQVAREHRLIIYPTLEQTARHVRHFSFPEEARFFTQSTAVLIKLRKHRRAYLFIRSDASKTGQRYGPSLREYISKWTAHNVFSKRNWEMRRNNCLISFQYSGKSLWGIFGPSYQILFWFLSKRVPREKTK